MADIKINPATPAANTGTPVQTAPAAKPAPASTMMPAAPPAPAAQPASSFKDLFSKTAAKTAGPKMIESIVTAKQTVGSKLKPILGSAPQLQKTLEQEKEHRQKKTLRLSEIVFVVCLVLGLLSAGYFYSELSPSFSLFGPNTTAKINDLNTNLSSLQTTIDKYRYLAAQLDLNSFSYAAEQFLDKTAKLSDPSYSDAYKAQLTSQVSELQTSIPTILEDLRKNLAADITIRTYQTEGADQMSDDAVLSKFQDDLKAALQADRDNIAAGSAGGATSQQDLKLYDNAIKLVGNNTLISKVKGLSMDSLKKDLDDYKTSQDPLIRARLQSTFSAILSSTSSDIATIASIKASRMDWSTIIKQIELVTASVDPHFGKGVYDQLGGITYNNYEFDQQSKKIAISGESKTLDATNFTLISNLIDKLEGSPYFKNVDMRSFSKSGDNTNGYIASFSISLSLETDQQATSAKVVSLGPDLLKVRTAYKRIRR